MMPADTDKATLPEKERALYRITLTILVMVIVLAALFAIRLRVHTDFMALWPLRTTADAFQQSAADWNDLMVRDVALFPPPAIGDSLSVSGWARTVQAHIGYPLTIILKRDSLIQTITRLPVPNTQGDVVLQSIAPELMQLFAGGGPVTADTIGSLILRRGILLQKYSPMNGAAVSLFEPRTGHTGWGVVQKSSDYRTAFARAALSYKHTPESNRLSTIVAVENPNYPGLRVFSGDSLIGNTPGLDTTRISYTVTDGSVREQYYLPYAQQLLADRLRKSWFPWFVCGICLLLMTVLVIFHRWFKAGPMN